MTDLSNNLPIKLPSDSNFPILRQEAGDNANQYQSLGNMTINNIMPSGNSNYSHYQKLVEEFQTELESGDTEFKEFIAKIQHYTSSNDGDVFIGLEKKLEEGGFQNDFTWANEAKLRYAKKLAENNLSRASQKIHAFVLAKIYVLFNMQIKNAINEGLPKDVIKDMIITKVITPIEDILGENNVLEMYSDDITDMIYFLTGNCHLKWK